MEKTCTSILKKKSVNDLKALYVVLSNIKDDIIQMQMLNCFCNTNKKEAKRFLLHTLLSEYIFEIEENQLYNIENLNNEQQLLYFLIKNNIDVSTMETGYDIGTVGLHVTIDNGFSVMGVNGEPIEYCFKNIKTLKSFLTRNKLISKKWTQNYNYEEINKYFEI